MTTQSFLPLVDDSTGVVLGIVGISTTTFDGTETSYTLDAEPRILKKVLIDPKSGAASPFYMAVAFTPENVRNMSFRNVSGFISMATFYVPQNWRQPQGTVGNDFLRDQSGVYSFLKTGIDLSTPTAPVTTVPTAANGTVNWNITTQFLGAPACTFVDINWVRTLAVDFADIVPGSIEVGQPTPNTILPFVRAYVIQTPAVQGSKVVYTTIRFVKIMQVDPAPGNYVYPCVITADNGQKVNVNLTLTLT